MKTRFFLTNILLATCALVASAGTVTPQLNCQRTTPA